MAPSAFIPLNATTTCKCIFFYFEVLKRKEEIDQIPLPDIIDEIKRKKISSLRLCTGLMKSELSGFLLAVSDFTQKFF